MPELDVSPEIEPKEASYLWSLIDELLWTVEIATVSICLVVPMASSRLALPKEDCLN